MMCCQNSLGCPVLSFQLTFGEFHTVKAADRLATVVWQVVVAVKRPLSSLVEHIHDVLSKLTGVSCVVILADIWSTSHS